MQSKGLKPISYEGVLDLNGNRGVLLRVMERKLSRWICARSTRLIRIWRYKVRRIWVSNRLQHHTQARHTPKIDNWHAYRCSTCCHGSARLIKVGSSGYSVSNGIGCV